MKPQISLIEGRHLTASDKRNILACIEYQRDKHPDTWGADWLGRKSSPKRYTVAPIPETAVATVRVVGQRLTAVTAPS